MPVASKISFCFGLVTVVGGSAYLQQLDTEKMQSIGRSMQEVGLVELTMTTNPIKLRLKPDGFSMSEPYEKVADGPLIIMKSMLIRGICLKAKAVDKDKIRFSFEPFINQKDVGKPKVDWTQVKDGSTDEVILYQAFSKVTINATEPVDVELSQRNWDSNLGNNTFLAVFIIGFIGFKGLHYLEVFSRK